MILTIDPKQCELATEHEACSTVIISFEHLGEIQEKQIRARTGCNFFCENHYKKQINLFEARQIKFCDPLLRHKKSVKVRLNDVTDELYYQVKHGLSVIVGDKICQHCLKTYIPKWLEENPADTQSSTTSCSQVDSQQSCYSTPREVQIELAKESIKNVQENLQMTCNDFPINKVSIRNHKNEYHRTIFRAILEFSYRNIANYSFFSEISE